MGEERFWPSPWKAVKSADGWQVIGKDGQLIAALKESSLSEKQAKLIAASPYLLDALKAGTDLIGDEDLPDNGELSGAAICDMMRDAVNLVGKL